MAPTNDDDTAKSHGRVPIDGPTLRSVRQSQGKILRQLARVAGLSHGHLGHVERGLRPVTPAIVSAYEKVLGLNIREVVAAGEIGKAPKPEYDNLDRYSIRRSMRKEWSSGQMTKPQRQSLMLHIAEAATSEDGSIEDDKRLLNRAGRPAPLNLDNPEEVTGLAAVVEALDELDAPAGEVAHHLLSWALEMRSQIFRNDFPQGVVVQAHTLITGLARRAGRGAESAGKQEAARTLYLLALRNSTMSGNPDLRAELLADLAQQHVTVGYPEDALAVLRLAAGDERISEDTLARLKEVRARAENPG